MSIVKEAVKAPPLLQVISPDTEVPVPQEHHHEYSMSAAFRPSWATIESLAQVQITELNPLYLYETSAHTLNDPAVTSHNGRYQLNGHNPPIFIQKPYYPWAYSITKAFEKAEQDPSYRGKAIQRIAGAMAEYAIQKQGIVFEQESQRKTRLEMYGKVYAGINTALKKQELEIDDFAFMHCDLVVKQPTIVLIYQTGKEKTIVKDGKVFL